MAQARRSIERSVRPKLRQRIGHRSGLLLRWMVRTTVPALWMLPVLILLAFVPIPIHVAALSDNGAEPTVMAIGLTVLGAVVTVAIAVLVFTAQAYLNSDQGRFDGLLDFAREIGLFRILNFGVAVLLTGGMVLLGFGDGAPGGWAATWFMILAAGFLVLLLLTFASNIRALEPDTASRRRLAKAQALTQKYAYRAAVRAHAAALVDSVLTNVGIESPAGLAFLKASGSPLALSPGAGEIVDLNLEALRSAYPYTSKVGSGGVTLVRSIGDRIDKGQDLLLADGITGRTPPFPKLVKLKEPASDELLGLVERHHEEALTAIRSGRPSWYETVRNTYAEFILGPFRHLSRFAEIDTTTDGGLTELPLDRIAQNLYEELLEAATGSAREVALDAIAFPFLVARDAAAIGVPSVFRVMLRLYPELYATLTRKLDTPHTDLIVERCSRFLVHIIDYPLEAALRDATSIGDVQQIADLIRIADQHVVELLLRSISAGDSKTTENLRRRWTDTLRYWRPEHHDPDLQMVAVMESRLGETPEVQEARKAALFNEAAASVKANLMHERRKAVFGLAMWALRRYRGSV